MAHILSVRQSGVVAEVKVKLEKGQYQCTVEVQVRFTFLSKLSVWMTIPLDIEYSICKMY